MSAHGAVCLRCSAPAADPYAPCPACLEAGVAVNHRPLAPPPVPASSPATPPTPLRAMRSCEHTWIKDERGGPTWSYKDRLAVAAVADAVATGAPAVVVSSSGNHGAAVAGAAGARGIPSVVLTIATIAPAMRRLIAGCGGRLVAMPTAEDRWAVMRDAVRELGWYPASNFSDPPIGSNPFAIDGYAAIAHELVAQLDRAPDWVVVPVGYGDGISGIARGFRDLAERGAIARAPRMLAAVTSPSLPEALAAGEDQPRAATVAAPLALSIACPQSTYQALHAVRASDGAAVLVDDAVALAARSELSHREGIYAELSSAVGWAAADQARRDGTIGARDTVVVVMTSPGLKDQTLPGDPTGELEVVPPRLDAVLAAIGDGDAPTTLTES